MELHQASYWTAIDGGKVRCELCRHCCAIPPGHRGLCGVRENHDGQLVSLNYGRVVAFAVDPVEKKPLYHVLPGTLSASLAAPGCNFRCVHCQNAGIAQPDWTALEAGWAGESCVAPDTLVTAARSHGCRSMAYTYTEPTVFYEYARDVARLATRQGLLNVFVTNGYLCEAPLRDLAPDLGAANIDLKCFRDDLYRELCGARLQGVLETIAAYHALGTWIEITTLIIPGYNDDAAQLRELAAFIAALDPGIPWHVTGFYPCHRLTDVPPTDLDTLRLARHIGLEQGLHFVYTGNRADPASAETRCPGCGALLIARAGMRAVEVRLGPDGGCPDCGRRIPGRW